ncbi:bifunctional hydroxymethylpyrimidine kinase/phosphomethylpyrimidine kinase [Cognatishimia activa]|uniref:hydroxymethylpyrimidine kinase n=1 Tax=Cognatishimia activa TaxID=1715691 RepID=A0A0P1JDE8_9RHOB|nr:bifunctional hydroxymethylpyrimidine kinase/phosphomethylpyrimidine kinase [Cognatishimia activa]CUI49090.1 Hydroxymethylpyrimidine/phosphomethylpyrimidine kinase [Cognatishimia activa]CUK27396.1 Hydroxymethylpyrimidine/phosphomethylpyrimidine kinase [Cognatishimia activa]
MSKGKAHAALTIAGSDSGGGAGIQADLKTFSALGVFGTSAITAITAQNTQDVTAVEPISNEVVAAQIKAVLDDIRIHAVKIGMLGSPALIETVAQSLKDFDGPVVLDPVMLSKSGVALLPNDAVEALVSILVPRATVLTPNLPEAAKILGEDEARGDDAVLAQGHKILDLGAKAVVMKGGHAEGETCRDWLVTPEGATHLDAPRIETRNTHGTGCTLSSAIAAELAKGADLEAALTRAHGWLHGAIQAADQIDIGHGHGPVHHFHEVWT